MDEWMDRYIYILAYTDDYEGGQTGSGRDRELE